MQTFFAWVPQCCNRLALPSFSYHMFDSLNERLPLERLCDKAPLLRTLPFSTLQFIQLPFQTDITFEACVKQRVPMLYVDLLLASAAPGNVPPSGAAYQQQSAGELLALLAGARGLVMVQLYVGWDDSLPQLCFHPFVVTLLARVAARKDLTITMSAVAGVCVGGGGELAVL